MGALRVLELFAGIGGLAATGAEVVAAVEIHERAAAVYRANFAQPIFIRTIESLPVADLRAWAADLWWLSPPCQPYTRRGLYRDVDDPRAAVLLSLLPKIEAVRPRFIALENVPGFAESESRRRLNETLDRAGYSVQERIVCPTDFGVPNRRRRFYLVAGLSPITPWCDPPPETRTLADYLDPPQEVTSETAVDSDVLARYHTAIHIVDANDPEAITNCFTAAYGRSPVRSGSYLRRDGRIRRFSPAEILRLLGFPADFRLPKMSLKQAWPLVGDSLAVPVVRRLLAMPARE